MPTYNFGKPTLKGGAMFWDFYSLLYTITDSWWYLIMGMQDFSLSPLCKLIFNLHLLAPAFAPHNCLSWWDWTSGACPHSSDTLHPSIVHSHHSHHPPAVIPDLIAHSMETSPSGANKELHTHTHRRRKTHWRWQWLFQSVAGKKPLAMSKLMQIN